jgi:glutamate synthase (ferredoxin)
MSGGIAFVLDETGDFATNRCNHELVGLEKVETPADIAVLKELVQNHATLTGSTSGRTRAEAVGRDPAEVHQDHAARLQKSPRTPCQGKRGVEAGSAAGELEEAKV